MPSEYQYHSVGKFTFYLTVSPRRLLVPGGSGLFTCVSPLLGVTPVGYELYVHLMKINNSNNMYLVWNQIKILMVPDQVIFHIP